MTAHAREFVQPLTFQTLSGRPVGTTLFDLDQESRIGHIRMAERAELVLVAPCTANVAAKLRAGIADDLLTTILLAATAPIYLALAMNDNMLANTATQENLEVLKRRGVRIIPPETGFLAEGREGLGRLADPARIVEAVTAHFQQPPAGGTVAPGAAGRPNLSGRAVLVTAGPTVEDIDPVRFLSNRSSGRMGFALAEECRDSGARVTLVTGPTALADPPGVTVQRVRSAEEMRRAVIERQAEQDALILAAAVSDYRVKHYSEQKIKRDGRETLMLELEMNEDIAAQAGQLKRPGQVLVVFAAESADLLANAAKKLEKKRADLVVANDITEPGSGFSGERNRVTLLRARDPQRPEALPLMDKHAVARRILAAVAEELQRNHG
jgi:phosphopantothenoylcysteine decarboxylase/phosphopantothenate--cysteine ligase